jgi:hypothetical protein
VWWGLAEFLSEGGEAKLRDEALRLYGRGWVCAQQQISENWYIVLFLLLISLMKTHLIAKYVEHCTHISQDLELEYSA